MAPATMIVSPLACASDGERGSARGRADRKATTMKIRINIEGRSIAATLADNDTARDFASLPPLELTLTEYAATERISDLPRRLSTEGAPPGIDPVAGDLTFYSPWGDLAIFYKDFSYSAGLIDLGRIDSGLEALNRPGPLRVTIERVE